jgi:hypothetical protein
MVALYAQNVEYNVLASGANWAWPVALRELFKPRDVNLLVAEKTDDFVEIIRHRRVHTTIVDMETRQDFLSKALQLNVFSVIEKPVDMEILRQQLNRLFLKRYNSDIFRQRETNM